MRGLSEWGEFQALSTLDDQSWILYRYILDRGPAPDLDELRAELRISPEGFDQCLERLRLLRLLRTDSTHGLIAVRPDVAAADVVDPLERQIYRLREEADGVRDTFRKLTSVYSRHQERQLRRDGETITSIPVDAGINCVISEIVYGGVTMVSLLHPGPVWFGALVDQVIAHAATITEQGASIQIVHGAASTNRASDGSLLTTAVPGCETRVVPDIVVGAVILRGQAAFLPTAAGSSDNAVVMVREATVVGALSSAFDQHWSAAVRLDEDVQPDAAGDEVKRRILELLAQGARDEMIARRVGMSVRTCRKYVAEIMRETGAQSRFQAGYLIGGTPRPDLD